MTLTDPFVSFCKIGRFHFNLRRLYFPLVCFTHTEDLFPIIFAYHTEKCQLIKYVKLNGNLPFLLRLRNGVGNLNADPLHQISVLNRCIIYFDRTHFGLAILVNVKNVRKKAHIYLTVEKK